MMRDCLACIVGHMGDENAVLAGLELITDNTGNSIPYYLRQAIENLLIKNVPITGSPGYYECHPKKNSGIKAKLLEMVEGDERRSKSAMMLLGWIERYRLERGRPALEARHPDFNCGTAWPLLEVIEK